MGLGVRDQGCHVRAQTRVAALGSAPPGKFKQCRVVRQVLLAAGDTFRAAAAEQLAGWAERAGAAIATASSARQRPDALLYSAVERVRAFHPMLCQKCVPCSVPLPLEPCT